MAEQQIAFHAALQHFGFTQPAMNSLIASGLTSSQDLIGIDAKDIENIMKIVRASTVPPMLVPYMAQKRLDIMCYWVNQRHRLQESIDANEFTPLAAEAFAKLMAFETQEEEMTTTKAPADFKPGSKWKPFKEGVIAYLNSIRG